MRRSIKPNSKYIVQSSNTSLDDCKQKYTEEEEKYIDYRLTDLQAWLLATVLEDTIVEMRMLDECNNSLRVIKTGIDMDIHLAKKYEIKYEIKGELEGIDPRMLGRNDYKLNKLDADRKYVLGTMETVYKELLLSKNFLSLHYYVNIQVDKDNYKKNISEKELKNRVMFRDLVKQLRQQRNHGKSVMYDADMTIEDLKWQVQDENLNAEIRSRYVANWQQARTEQHILTIERDEARPLSVIEYYKHRTDHEQRAHSDVELMCNITINETLEKVEQWMNKYDIDMEQIDLKIRKQKIEYQDELAKRIDLEEMIDNHDTKMKDWIYFKEEREKRRQYEEKMNKAAIIIQAWWRGFLARHPPKKGKKNAGKKK